MRASLASTVPSPSSCVRAIRRAVEHSLHTGGVKFDPCIAHQTWSLRELDGKPAPDGLDASLKIDGALRGSGFTGCNSWPATLYPVKDQHLAVGPFALTKKQCPKDVMAVELGLLSSLIGNPAWDFVNGDLVIKGPRGSMRLARSL